MEGNCNFWVEKSRPPKLPGIRLKVYVAVTRIVN